MYSLFDRDALELGFSFGFYLLDRFVVGEMLDILGVVVRLVSLRFGSRVENFCGKLSETIEDLGKLLTFMMQEELWRRQARN
jgi:hypothetical protein